MASNTYLGLTQNAIKALRSKDLAKLDEIGKKLDDILHGEKGQDNHADPDIISIGEFIDYAETLINKGFTENINGEIVNVPWSKEQAEKLIEYWFGEGF